MSGATFGEKLATRATAAKERAISAGSEALKTASESIRPSSTDTAVFHSTPGVPQAVREAVAQKTAPFAVLDLDAFRTNAKDLATRARGKDIRVVTTSLRIPNAIKEALSSEGFSGALASSLREAIWLVRQQIADDVLVAYPTTDREALATLADDPKLASAITLVVDSAEYLDFLDQVTDPKTRQELRLCLDIDASLVIGRGMYIPGFSKGDTSMLWNLEPISSGRSLRIGALRSPVHGVKDAQEVVEVTWTRQNMKVVGILAFESQIADYPDSGRGVRQTVRRVMQTLSRGEIASRRNAIVDGVNYSLTAAGREPLEFVNAGGTGSLDSTATESAVTEVAAGSGLVGPALFDGFRNFRPLPAQWFVLPVTRRPGKGVVTVAGGGRIASGAPGEDRLPAIDFPRGLEYGKHEGAGSVQTPLIGEAADGLRIGDKVWFRHAKAGEASEWINEVVVVSNGEIVDTWNTYRGEGLHFS